AWPLWSQSLKNKILLFFPSSVPRSYRTVHGDEENCWDHPHPSHLRWYLLKDLSLHSSHYPDNLEPPYLRSWMPQNIRQAYPFCKQSPRHSGYQSFRLAPKKPRVSQVILASNRHRHNRKPEE